MLRILVFVIIVAAFGFGFAYVADTPGTIVVTVSGNEITVSLMVAAVALVASIVAVMVTWWLVRVIWTSPFRVQRFFRARRRDRGYQSLSTGIIAAGAGDSQTAQRMLKQATGLLNVTSEPMIQLLDAQASLAEGDYTKAREKFEAMLEDPELRILGMRGLYMEANRLGDREAARHYAEKAAELAPQLAWAGNAALELKTAAGDWDGAVRLLDNQKNARQLGRDEAKRKRAVLLTAMARDLLEKDPAKARTSAGEAHRLAPDFVPAATVAAQAAFRLNDMRRGVNALEATWRHSPHPDIAIAYINARPGDSAHDRYKRARRLERLKPNNIESSMIVAQAAMEAGEYADARKAVASVLRNEPREGAFMLMADIEDAETGDQGKVREWLARAVRAPRDPAWTADGYVSEIWLPVSPISGRLDVFEWKVPVERLGPVLENDLDPMVPGIPAQQPPAVVDTPVEEGETVIDGSTAEAPAEPEEVIASAETAETETPKVIDLEPEPAEAEKATTEKPLPEAVQEPEPAAESEPEPETTAQEEAGESPASEPPPEAAETPPAKAGNGATEPEEQAFPPVPDDPGVDPNEAPEPTTGRFRLF